MLLLDLSHTAHTRARTGVQRVARALYRELGNRAEAMCYDPFERAWRPLEGWEHANLAAEQPAPGRGERWPLSARIRGSLRRSRPASPNRPDPGTPRGVLVPEIFSPTVAGALPGLFGANAGPRVALFHDAIALQYPEFSPRSTVARFPGYLQELLGFDGVAANSEASREALVGYWRWLGVSKTPQVTVVPLGLEPPPSPPSEQPPASDFPTVLCVGSIEGRKNHAALLAGCEHLWSRGLRFELRMIGLANSETGRTALDSLERLRSSGRPVRYDGPVGDGLLEAAYRQCAFTVYPSLAEGFGLPVAESLSRGKPCVCQFRGALGEIARGGGCAELAGASAEAVARAVGRLLEYPAELASLSQAARARWFPTWAETVAHLTDWMASLRSAV